MPKNSIVLLAFALFGAAISATSLAWPADRAGADATIPQYTDRAQVQAATQAVVDGLHAHALASGLDPGSAPIIEVRMSPQLISFDPDTRKLVVPAAWTDMPPEAQAAFVRFSGSDAEAVRVFRAFFHRFFIAHEAAHWLRHSGGKPNATPYADEDEANRLAVAYWRMQPDGEAYLAQLEGMLTGIVARIPDPTPAGQNPVKFFSDHYEELALDAMKYGYYQFRFVLDAVRQRAQLDLDPMLAGIANEQR